MPETRQPSLLLLAIRPFRDCLSFAGRSTRSELFTFLGFGMLANAVRPAFFGDPPTPPSWTEIGWMAFWTVPLAALTVRRLHDQGRSAWWLLVQAAAVLVWAIAAWLPQGGGGRFTLLLWKAHPAPGLAATLLELAYLGLIICTIILDFLPGTAGDNQYGSDPRKGSSATLAPM
ncbi:DUF805 domain-containing protein [Sphingomonas sp. LM7]|uniref:DUF805 domain-containing protein n=1 Tax=Sphingomonas sp. LM7 TaxID=1938607 RepID=UPI0009839228|nr:DUF805 domain-containing protein [Sphingomonas sp. LM7]AQR73738.1 hypothetical protein BXU08_08855 [Sphingomonas sp. LM7]